MISYTVKQIADMFKTSEETVRRWIRSGKLEATQNSKKDGNVISADALKRFVKGKPKYEAILATSIRNTPLALPIVVGSLISGMIALQGDKKKKITVADVEKFLNKKMDKHKRNIVAKEDEMRKLKSEIEEEYINFNKYKFALENIDLSTIVFELNKEHM